MWARVGVAERRVGFRDQPRQLRRGLGDPAAHLGPIRGDQLDRFDAVHYRRLIDGGQPRAVGGESKADVH